MSWLLSTLKMFNLQSIFTSKNGSGAQCVCGSVSYEKCMMHHEEENLTTRLTVEQLKSCNQQEWTKTPLAKNKK